LLNARVVSLLRFELRDQSLRAIVVIVEAVSRQ
jgi:hypothetical protein